MSNKGRVIFSMFWRVNKINYNKLCGKRTSTGEGKRWSKNGYPDISNIICIKLCIWYEKISARNGKKGRNEIKNKVTGKWMWWSSNSSEFTVKYN